MSTRACAADAFADMSNKPCVHNDIIEPLMFTTRELSAGEGNNSIWWYIATLLEDVSVR